MKNVKTEGEAMGNGKALGIAGVALAALVGGVGVWGMAAGPGKAKAVRVTMYRSPGCSCCNGWKEHMEAAGFEVTTVATDRLYQVKLDRGVPTELASCHTAVVDGRVVEGHVPPEDVRRMLRDAEGPVGIAVPGMPSGSPGMSGAPEAYDVIAFEAGEAGDVFASH